jgi:glyoxylase-like metal-dependent hydrolase (beta-lactamase superfamily II)
MTPALLFCVALALPAGITLVPGAFASGTQPDGNSVVLDAPEGLIVVDTGRHPEHAAAILDVARRAGKPIVAVVNSHWHLDHVGGNPALRRAYPRLRVYASGALDDARHGFLADYAKQPRRRARTAGRRTRPPLLSGSDPKFVRALVDYHVDSGLRGDANANAALCGA